jgi:hypothetical protein
MDNEYNDYQDENDYDEYYSDAETERIYSDNEDEINENEYNPYIGVRRRPNIKWSLIKIGKAILEVSSIGTIKPYRSINNPTEGIILEGTPYRYYRVEENEGEYKNYYVHEIVWQAFNGTPADEYEIKHKPEYTDNYRKIYSNRLHNITLVKKVDIVPFRLSKSKTKK